MRQCFPQSGILTSLNAAKAEAKVMIPILQHETEWCPVITNLFYEKNVQETDIESDNFTLYSDILQTSAIVSGPKSTEAKRKIQKQEYHTLQVGDEVLVIFLNGDIHQPIVIGRL